MAARYSASYRGIGAMLRSEPMVAEMRRRAEVGKAYAEAIAPVQSGDYARSFVASADVRPGKTRRARGRLANTDRSAFQIEVGTRRTPAHHTLKRALGAMAKG